MIIEGPTSLNYYWVPLLVRADVLANFGLLQQKYHRLGWLKQQGFIPYFFEA